MKWIFQSLAWLSGLGALYAIWHDLTEQMSPSISLGQLWYTHSPQSLQQAETVVSRYIDPCSLVAALDCAPFLWHPTISTLLTWPAALVLVGFATLFGLAGPRRTASANRSWSSRGRRPKDYQK